MPRIKSANLLKYATGTMLFLSLFVVPFLAFGHSVEQFARSFFDNDAGSTGTMVVGGMLLAADPLLPIPSSVVATLLGAKLGLVRATLVNGAGLSMACVIGYALGRMGGSMFERVDRGLPAPFADWVRQHGLIAVLLCRPVPVLAEASLIVAGAAHHAPRALLAWCCVTQMALGLAYAYAGSGWGQDRWSGIAIFAGSVLLPLAGALLVALFMWLSGDAQHTAVPVRDPRPEQIP